MPNDHQPMHIQIGQNKTNLQKFVLIPRNLPQSKVMVQGRAVMTAGINQNIRRKNCVNSKG